MTEDNEFRARILGEALRIVAASPAPVTCFAVQRQCETALNAKEEESAAEVSGALHLLCLSGLILSNRFDRETSVTTFSADTTFVSSKRLTSFVWGEQAVEGEDGQDDD